MIIKIALTLTLLKTKTTKHFFFLKLHLSTFFKYSSILFAQPMTQPLCLVFVCACFVLLLAGIHHDRVPAAELARWPPVLQSHQQDTRVGQSLRGQAVASRHLHCQCQICLVSRCDSWEQTDSPAAQWSHSIQQPVWVKRWFTRLLHISWCYDVDPFHNTHISCLLSLVMKIPDELRAVFSMVTS